MLFLVATGSETAYNAITLLEIMEMWYFIVSVRHGVVVKNTDFYFYLKVGWVYLLIDKILKRYRINKVLWSNMKLKSQHSINTIPFFLLK